MKNIIEKKEVENITIKQKHEKYAKDLENKLKNDNEKLYFEQEKVKHVLKELENYKKNESNNAHQNYKHIEVLNNEIKKIVDERNKVFEQMNVIAKSKDLEINEMKKKLNQLAENNKNMNIDTNFNNAKSKKSLKEIIKNMTPEKIEEVKYDPNNKRGSLFGKIWGLFKKNDPQKINLKPNYTDEQMEQDLMGLANLKTNLLLSRFFFQILFK
mgnify:CR=1 FL=1